MDRFKNSSHLFRLAFLFLFGFAVLAVLRGVLLPKSFGKYGHFRGDAMSEIAARPVHYAGHDTCETCHAEVLEKKSKGTHAHVACESCHGPLQAHAEDPSVKPVKLEAATLCKRCHESNAAKPKKFPQVATEEHSGGLPCDTCHQPHSPKIEAQAKQ